MDFIAIDVETANENMASICQIGIAGFRDGRVVDEWKSLVDPEDYFAPRNMRIHHITPAMVAGAPTLPEVAAILGTWMTDRVVVSHMPFDRVAIHQALAKHDLPMPQARWIDTARVARRTWSECAYSGYGLAPVAAMIGYTFAHHDALEDAKAAGHVLLAAVEVSGTALDGWLSMAASPTTPGPSVRRVGNSDGPLAGEVIVFTGALMVPRQTAADMAQGVGCEVGENVTQRTTLLVVGDQDLALLAGHDKSNKHRKAETLIEKGQPLRILSESDFMQMVAFERSGAVARSAPRARRRSGPSGDGGLTITISLEDVAEGFRDALSGKPDSDDPAQAGDLTRHLAAHRLAVRFSDPADIPARLRTAAPSPSENRPTRRDSTVEARFKENVSQWDHLLAHLFESRDADLAWRFANIAPIIEERLDSVSQCRDWCDFVDYLSERRDGDEACRTDELGLLCLLLGSFQAEVERHL